MSVILLPNRSVFLLSGLDSKKFLQGIITNDAYKLSYQAIYAFLLNSRGKYLYDFFLVARDDQILIDYETNFKSDIVQLLKKYKIGYEVLLKSTRYKVYSSFEPMNIPNIIAFSDPRSGNMGYRILSAEELSYSSEVDQYEVKRIANVIPDGAKDLLHNKSFPFECDTSFAIDHSKGCYVGQEIVARTTSSGVVRKKLFMVESDEDLPGIGSEVLDQKNKNKLGEMRSSVGRVGLALLNIEETKLAIADNINIITNEAKIKVHGL